MVSRIRYPHMVNQYFHGKKPVEHLLGVAAVFGLIWLCGLQSAFGVGVCRLSFSGLVRWLTTRTKTPRVATEEFPKPTEPNSGTPTV